MSEIKRFTFKTSKETGKFSSFQPVFLIIKYKGFEVGEINKNNLVIRLKVWKEDLQEDGNPNCNWKWISLAKKVSSFEETKVWLNEKVEVLFKVYDLKVTTEKL